MLIEVPMATIRKLDSKTKGIRYKAVIRRDQVVLTAKTFSRKTDAVAWARRVEADQEQMEALGQPTSRKTFSKLADAFFEEWEGKDDMLPIRTKWWVDQLGTMPLVQITDQLLDDRLTLFAKGRKPATVNRMRAAASTLFRFAVRQRWLNTNPCEKVAHRTEKNQRIRFLDADERKRLLDACQESEWERLHLLVLMALTTGARRGELLKLRWCDVDLERREAVCYDTKNGTNRILTLPLFVVTELSRFREVGDGLLFPRSKDPHQPFTFRKHWERALREAGIEDFRFHDLRHSAASYLIMNGASLYEVAQVLGHKTTATTERYAHLSTQHKKDLTDRIMGDVFKDE
jgi:integrase